MSEMANLGTTYGKRAKKTGYIVLAIVLVMAAVGIVAYIRIFFTGFQTTDDAAVNGNRAVVSAQTLDRVVRMAAAEGDRVEKGEVMALLDDSVLKAQENRMIVNQEYAAENTALARVRLDQSKADLARATVLLQNKIIPQEQYDHLRDAYKAALAGAKIATSQQKQAAAELQEVETNLSHTVLLSPVTGVVAKKWAIAGEVVQPAQAIYTVCDLDHLWIEANFKETQIRTMKAGDAATFTVDAFPGRTFAGRVESIGATTASSFALIPQDNSAGNFTKVTQRVPVRISIDGGTGSHERTGVRLLPGMSAEVKIRTGKE